MATFEEVVSKAKSVAESAGKKTSDFIEVTKLKIKAADKEREIASTLEGLGRLVYDGRKSDQDVMGLIDDCIKAVDEQYVDLKEINEKIMAYQDILICPQCGASNAEDALYCNRCGASLKG